MTTPEPDAPTLGSTWRRLGAGGATISAGDGVIVAASIGDLQVWQGESAHRHSASAQAPGRARIVTDRTAGTTVCWGPHRIDVDHGTIDLLDELLTASVPARWPAGGPPGPRATTYAWAPDGDSVLVIIGNDGATSSASATVRSADGSPVIELWRGEGVAPVATWLGTTIAVIGSGRTEVFDLDGRQIAQLEGIVPPIRIDATADEQTFLVVGHDRLVRWDVDSKRATTAPGAWLDAAIAPDGGEVAAITLTGELVLLGNDLQPIRALDTPGPPSGVALGTTQLVIAASGEILTAPRTPR